MAEDSSRRDFLATAAAAAAASVAVPGVHAEQTPAGTPVPAPRPLPPQVSRVTGEITDLVSTSDVFIPPRGRSFMKFSFDFPEPAVAFGDHRFSFLIFTDENTYSLDRAGMKATGNADALTLSGDGFVWAGGQQKAPGKLTARFAKTAEAIEWDVTVEMDRPVKSVTTVIRDVPRGKISLGGESSATPAMATCSPATPSARATFTAARRR